MKSPYIELTNLHVGSTAGTAGRPMHVADEVVMVDLLPVSHCLPWL